MRRGPTGLYQTTSTSGEAVRAFVPFDLPPEPPLELDEGLQQLLHKAYLELGRLDGLSSQLPDPHLFLYTYVRKEAVLSSQIEGTQSSLSDLLRHEVNDTPVALREDVLEVSRYVQALEYGLDAWRGGMPICLRLVREIHARLLSGGRGARHQPGEFRQSQNWIGGSRPGNAAFVPPPHHELPARLAAWERFIHNDPVTTPTLIKAALIHVQFETLHPFLDGNGRLGRLLITLLLCAEGVLAQPMLYLSLHFRRNRNLYYEHLQNVRMHGDWEGWLRYFLEGVVEIAGNANRSARQLLQLFNNDRTRLAGVSASTLRLHDHLQRNPVVTVAEAEQVLQLTHPAATATIRTLESKGILEEVTGGHYRRVWVYQDSLRILQETDTPNI